MIIKSLKLKNYRNYELLNMAFDARTNILYGDNAQGKTNILEALYLSGTTKSHRRKSISEDSFETGKGFDSPFKEDKCYHACSKSYRRFCEIPGWVRSGIMEH